MKESDVLKGVKKIIEIFNLNIWRNNTGAISTKNKKTGKTFIRFGKVGSADFIGYDHTGRFVAIECKSDKGILSESQSNFLSSVSSFGGVAIVVHSADEALAQLKEKGVIL